MDNNITKIVAEGLHPWVKFVIKDNIVQATVPPYNEIIKASTRLIKHLRENGFEIKRIDK